MCVLLYTGNNAPGIIKWPCVVNLWVYSSVSRIELGRGVYSGGLKMVSTLFEIKRNMPSVLLRRGRVH